MSSEEPADYLVRTLHLFHHGPYYCQPASDKGEAPGIAIPLLNLVYHDSILLPWNMGEGGGWGIPASDAGFLHCLLNAGLPYVGAGMPFQGVDVVNKEVARVNEAADLAQRCGLSEMVNHEFLDDTYRKQRTTFANGTRVTVDFDAKTYAIDHKE